jgi:hypothetical protein
MRKELQKQEGQRKKFNAVFVKVGSKRNYHGYAEETILLKNIRDVESQKIVTDHVWFSYTKTFQSIPLTEGVRLEFEARIKEYKKGYVNSRYKIDNRIKDYKLSHPTKIRLVNV